MNREVTATGMQVVAKSDNTYLLISSTNTTASTIQGENVITTALTVSDADAKLYPSAPAMSDAEVAYLSVEDGHNTVAGVAITTAGVKINNESTANAVTNWYTAYAEASSASTIKASTAKQLTNFSGYVIKKTVYLTVAAGANPCNNLTVTPTFTQKGSGSDLSAAKILITTDDGACTIISSTNNSAAVDIKGSNTEITDSTVRTVYIYIFYDGNDSNVYTNNAANLTGATINLSFKVDAVPAA